MFGEISGPLNDSRIRLREIFRNGALKLDTVIKDAQGENTRLTSIELRLDTIESRLDLVLQRLTHPQIDVVPQIVTLENAVDALRDV